MKYIKLFESIDEKINNIKDIFLELEDKGFTINVNYYDKSVLIHKYNDHKIDLFNIDTDIKYCILRLIDYLGKDNVYNIIVSKKHNPDPEKIISITEYGVYGYGGLIDYPIQGIYIKYEL